MVEFLLVFPLMFLVVWGGFALGMQTIDGMILKYAAYEEVRRAALDPPERTERLLLVARAITGWSSGRRGLLLHGRVDHADKLVTLEAVQVKPWWVDGFAGYLGVFSSHFSAAMRSLRLATGAAGISYSLPCEGKEMYPRNLLEWLADLFGIPED